MKRLILLLALLMACGGSKAEVETTAAKAPVDDPFCEHEDDGGPTHQISISENDMLVASARGERHHVADEGELRRALLSLRTVEPDLDVIGIWGTRGDNYDMAKQVALESGFLQTPACGIEDIVTEGPEAKGHHREYASVGDELDEDSIQRVISQRIGQTRVCYERAKQAEPELAGRTDIKFLISADGSVKSADVVSSTLGKPKVERCLEMVVRQWSFPKPEEGELGVTYPFILK